MEEKKETKKIKQMKESKGDENPLAEIDIGEPLVSGGIAATLALLRNKGVDNEPLDTVVGRKNDKIKDVDKRDPAPQLRLEYLDEYGRPLTPKEAFRQISHKFHGKKPGKNKQEKQIKKLKEDMKRKGMSAIDTPNMTVEAMKSEQERTQQAFILLSGASSAITSGIEAAALLEHKEVPLRKRENKQPGLKDGEFQEFSFARPTKQQKRL